MKYQKQNFSDGQVLNANHLNHIEDGIARLADEVENIDPSQGGGSGADGFSPTATVTESTTGATITITDKNGTTSATILHGKDGKDGTNGKNGNNGVGITSIRITEV